MNRRINPFHELYVTESIGSDAFVELFSDKLIDHTSALFKPGNVILKGLPGTGKSMMLNLLKPSIRLAYHRCKVEFPVPSKQKKFIGAGINLVRSSVSDFGQRPISDSGNEDLNELAVYFGDFLNYWVVRDILNSLQELGAELSQEIGIDLNINKLENFTDLLKKDEAWFGYLDGISSFSELNDTLKKRIISYRSYLNYNSDRLPDAIKKSKTAIGIPILATANYLRRCGIIEPDVQIFIRIDQYEELAWLDESIKGLGKSYQSVIHKLLAMRDASVSYRIGTRPFAWNDDSQTILGTTAQLESNRNYMPISIDEFLRRPENTKTYIFPKFAEDIFEKRLKVSNYYIGEGATNLLKEVFGNGLSATEKALKYVANSKERAIELEDSWPANWKEFLKNLAKIDPLSARLGEAWARQAGKGDIIFNIPLEKPYPWESKTYWKKERTEQALVQIASRNRQQLIWDGKEDILKLSGGNILAFLSLCQQIWEVWMRDLKTISQDNVLPSLDPVIQTLGILEASSKWFENISNEKGGRDRKQFITFIGNKFYKNLTDDSKMSYPGRNGFSLKSKELEKYRNIEKFLKDASDYGDLHERHHTTKEKSSDNRIKWYLNPILSPRFKIPASHTKEPLYISIDQIESWLIESGVFSQSDHTPVPIKTPKIKTKKSDPQQGNLFN